ncbi:cytochrome c oxidase subunit 3 [Hymenobacter saemangeumensis]|uniref:Cytochrome c oxidase subunit 3 n=2 Tax=Hymenobacter saemangeumensis TaxID=1084522 RepID=A0ABP8IGZ7_9BACT
MLLVLYLGLVAITSMFVILVGAYIHTHHSNEVPSGLHPFPRYFSLSTIVLLLSSYTIGQARTLYQRDDLVALARCLAATLLLGCVFSGLQFLGWRELVQQGVFFSGEASGTYIYLISALHVVHLLGGMLYLLVLLLRVIHAERDAIRALVFIRNPYYRRQLTLAATYWHFIDALWVALFAVFLFLY